MDSNNFVVNNNQMSAYSNKMFWIHERQLNTEDIEQFFIISNNRYINIFIGLLVFIYKCYICLI